MINTIIINKKGENKIKNIVSIDLLFKACLFKKINDFSMKFKWTNVNINNILLDVYLWGKTTGTKNNINTLNNLSEITNFTFYNSIAFIFTYPNEENNYYNIDTITWDSFYDKYIINNKNDNNNHDNNNHHYNQHDDENEAKKSDNASSTSYENSDYELDEDFFNKSDNSSDSETEENIIDNNYQEENANNIFKELTYEPYYFSSDED